MVKLFSQVSVGRVLDLDTLEDVRDVEILGLNIVTYISKTSTKSLKSIISTCQRVESIDCWESWTTWSSSRSTDEILSIASLNETISDSELVWSNGLFWDSDADCIIGHAGDTDLPFTIFTNERAPRRWLTDVIIGIATRWFTSTLVLTWIVRLANMCFI